MSKCEWGGEGCNREAEAALVNLYDWPVNQKLAGTPRGYCGLHVIRTVAFRLTDRVEPIAVLPLDVLPEEVWKPAPGTPVIALGVDGSDG